MQLCNVLWLTWKEFYERTNISGASNAGIAKNPLRKIIWMVVFIVGLAFTIQGVYVVIYKYLEFPVDTIIKLEHKNKVVLMLYNFSGAQHTIH